MSFSLCVFCLLLVLFWGGREGGLYIRISNMLIYVVSHVHCSRPLLHVQSSGLVAKIINSITGKCFNKLGTGAIFMTVADFVQNSFEKVRVSQDCGIDSIIIKLIFLLVCESILNQIFRIKGIAFVFM